MAEGWIQVERSIAESIVNSDPGLLHLLINLRWRAAWKETYFAKQRIKCGQAAFSAAKFAEALGISRDTLMRRLKVLADHGFIRIEKDHPSHNRFSLITLLENPTCGDDSANARTAGQPANAATAATANAQPEQQPTHNPPDNGSGSGSGSEQGNERTAAATHSKKVINKQSSSPLPPSGDPDAAAWSEEERELGKIGVGNARVAVGDARLHGCTAAEVRAVREFFVANPGEWTAGMLSYRVSKLMPGQRPEELGWPERASVAEAAKRAGSDRTVSDMLARRQDSHDRRAQRQREREAFFADLETKFGRRLDALTGKQVVVLTNRNCGAEAKGFLEVYKHGQPPEGTHREALLKALERGEALAGKKHQEAAT